MNELEEWVLERNSIQNDITPYEIRGGVVYQFGWPITWPEIPYTDEQRRRAVAEKEARWVRLTETQPLPGESEDQYVARTDPTRP